MAGTLPRLNLVSSDLREGGGSVNVRQLNGGRAKVRRDSQGSHSGCEDARSCKELQPATAWLCSGPLRAVLARNGLQIECLVSTTDCSGTRTVRARNVRLLERSTWHATWVRQSPMDTRSHHHKRHRTLRAAAPRPMRGPQGSGRMLMQEMTEGRIPLITPDIILPTQLPTAARQPARSCEPGGVARANFSTGTSSNPTKLPRWRVTDNADKGEKEQYRGTHSVSGR
jgi:hypothetical protein